MNYIEIATNVFDIEIDGMREVCQKIDENFSRAVEAILETQGRVVITGMGKSGIVGKKITATLASTGTRAFFVHPGEAYHGDLGMISSSDVILAISNSGETEEIIKLLSFFKDNKNTVIAMTGKRESTLAKHSDLFLDIGISKEACPLELAPTTSTTVTQAYGDALAVALMEARGFKAENFARFHPGGSLGRKLLTKVSDLMKTDDLPVISENTDFDDIIDTLSRGRMGLCVVLNGSEVIGLITDGDIRRALKEKKEKALTLKARDFGLKKPVAIASSEKIILAEEIMNERKITALVVIDENKFKGLLHLYDL